MKSLKLTSLSLLVLLLNINLGVQCAVATVTRYVAPAVRGTGTGDSPANAASYENPAFWSGVQKSLATDAVTVRWLDGNYNSTGLTLTEMGDPYHQLRLTGDSPTGAILNAPVKNMLCFLGVQNSTVSRLTFTGPIESFGFLISSNRATPSKKIVLDSLTFKDLTLVHFGAIGTSRNTYDISVRNSTFDNVGFDSHAHMMYNAYDPHHLSVYNNTFIDSKGDYVRFRDNTDYGSVIGNTFLSTNSTYNRPFLAMPLFNDIDPGDEFFATHYLIRDNQFKYNSKGTSSDRRNAITFGQWGYDPPGYRNLMTAAEAAILQRGTTEQKKGLLLANTGINGDKVHVYNNRFTNANYQGAYASFANYGAISKGWAGYANVFATWNHTVPNRQPNSKLVDWRFDASDNGGTGWINNSYQALENAGWQFNPGAANDARTFVDTSGTVENASGLMWLRDGAGGKSISADYQFEGLTAGRIQWTMGIAGTGAEFRLFNGRSNERGLSLLGVQLVNPSTVRILGDPSSTQDKSFAGVDFGALHTWRWDWTCDPDGVNGLASLKFQRADGTWAIVYQKRAFDANVVPDTFWISVAAKRGYYISLDSFSITAFPVAEPPAGTAAASADVDEDRRSL